MLQLKYFSELAKRQHLNKTAQEMLVTPSAISSSLARLEKEMGVKLFDRVGRNIRLNNYGKILQKYVIRSFMRWTVQRRSSRRLRIWAKQASLWR